MTGQEIAEVNDYGKILSHPLRLQILTIVAKGPVSPVVTSKKHGVGKLGVVSYHFNQLAELGCVGIHRTRPRRGTIEHYFEVTERGLRVLLIAEEIINPKFGELAEESPNKPEDHETPICDKQCTSPADEGKESAGEADDQSPDV